MAFPKDHSAEITLIYYCCTLTLAIAAFVYGTILLPQRGRRDEQRREWRKFAKSVFSENNNLRAHDIPQRISKVKDTFKKIQINSLITGLDVLRYMLAERNYESFKTNELECLHDNLQSIFQLFSDIHSSLPLLGKVPRNIKEKLKDVVTELGMMVEPFFERGKREIILECLEHFLNDRLDQETERRVRKSSLEAAVPYVKTCLLFGAPEASLLDGFNDTITTMKLETRLDYSKCSNFSLYIKDNNTHGSDISVVSLQDLHNALVDPRSLEQNAMKLRMLEPPLNLIEKINEDDTAKCVVEKVLHEIRLYIHNGSQNGKEIKDNMEKLLNVWKDMKMIKPSEVTVKVICERLIVDLQARLQISQLHCNGEQFCKNLQKLLQNNLKDLQQIKWDDSTTHSSTLQIGNP